MHTIKVAAHRKGLSSLRNVLRDDLTIISSTRRETVAKSPTAFAEITKALSSWREPVWFFTGHSYAIPLPKSGTATFTGSVVTRGRGRRLVMYVNQLEDGTEMVVRSA